MEEDIHRIYKYFDWPRYPDDRRAIARSKNLVEMFKRVLKSHKAFNDIRKLNKLKILEIGSATGIAGASLAKALSDLGFQVEIDFTDIRYDELIYVDSWIGIHGISNIRYNKYVLDCRYIPRDVEEGEFHIVLFFGSSLPHLDNLEYVLTVLGIHHSLDFRGVYIVEQANIGWNLIRRRDFKDMLIESISDDGSGLLSTYSGYNKFLGVQYRRYYKIPGMEYIGMMKSRLWDIASIIGINWIFFRHVDLMDIKDMRETNLVISWNKRDLKVKWSEFMDDLQNLNR